MRLGIDLGGTKIAAVVLGDGDAVIWEHRVATPRDDYQGTIEAIAAVVDAGDRAAGARCTVGLGIPGAISPATGLIKNANSTWLNGRPFDRDLAARLARPVVLANDANCLAMSEAADGAAAGAEVVFGVILGTGTGGGIVVNGRLLSGPNAIAGEWGHNPLPWPRDDERPGTPCWCGQSGCIETFLCGPALARDYAASTGETVPAEEVAARIAADRPAALAVLERYLDRLARALASVINLIDPEVIVLGGGVSNIDKLYAPLPERLGAYVFSREPLATRVVRARYGDSSGVRGAAWLWPAT
jgi:fructokinase